MQSGRKRIICCTPFFSEEWNWFADEMSPEGLIDWQFFNDRRTGFLETSFRQLNLATLRAGWQAVKAAQQQQADLLITHDPRISFWCAFFARLLRLKTPHIAYSFNFPELPEGKKKQLMQWAFASVSQFIVYSKVEKQIYSDYFAIPAERFQVTLWGVTPPVVEPNGPLEAGDYICAIGGNARDYPTLIRAMESLPEIPLVIVVRPENLAEMKLPANVKPLVNLPFGQAMNILKHSRFMVIPLKGSKVPCGHVTLVAAMHLGKSFIITNSDGVSDYVIPEVNGITCQPFDSEALASAIRRLWQDPPKCQEMGKNGQHFADQNCSETAARQALAAILRSRHILSEP